MGKKFYQNEKFQGIFFPILYFLLAIGIAVTGCVIFYNKYYTPILVDGISMRPTLIGGGSTTIDGQTYYFRNHYGIADLHKSAVNNLKRFDVCVTYYPDSWTAEDGASIIKRVWGFPGETIRLTYDSGTHTFTFGVSKNGEKEKIYKAPVVEVTRKYEATYSVNGKTKYTTISETFEAAKFNVGNKTFYTNLRQGSSVAYRTFQKTLAKNEYFVMGDNWAGSSDSYTNMSKVELLTKGKLQGKAIAINAYASTRNSQAVNIHKIKAKYNF